MPNLGKSLVIIGLGLAAVGALIWLLGGRSSGGLLPGDLSFRRGSFSFHFPLVTCLIVSVVLTLVLRWFQK
jgi:hypothetical protein